MRERLMIVTAQPVDKVPPWQESPFGVWLRRFVYDVATRWIERNLRRHKRKAAAHFAWVRYYGEEKRRWQQLERP